MSGIDTQYQRMIVDYYNMKFVTKILSDNASIKSM